VLAREQGGYAQPLPVRYSAAPGGSGKGPDRSQDRSRGAEKMSITSIIWFGLWGLKNDRIWTTVSRRDEAKNL
jgi:hypothetical protein